MAWPDDRDLPIDVEMAFGADVTADPSTWLWTSLTDRLLNVPITNRVGASSGGGQVSPGSCTVTLLNTDGALTPLHPMSPFWPNVELGTPLRVSLRRVEDAFARTATGWGAADSGQSWSGHGAGGTVLTTDFSVAGGKARHSVPTASAYRTSWLPGVSLRDCRVRLSGVSLPFTDVTGGPVEPGNILLRAQSISTYYLARVEITAIESVVCKLYNPAGTLLASATVPGLVHSLAQPLEVVAEINGTELGMKVWRSSGTEPAGWTVTATDDTLSLPGGVGVRTGVGSGNTNTKPIVASYESLTVSVDLAGGNADQWEPAYAPTGVVGDMYSAVRITASGILRRLGQGRAPSKSPLRRTIAASGPVAYWPGEDGDASTQAGSAIVGQPPLAVTGTVKFTAVEDDAFLDWRTYRFGTAAVADLSAGGMIAADVPPAATAATATGWTVAVSAAVDVNLASGDVVIAEVATPGGTFVRWQLVQRKATLHAQIVAFTASGSSTVVYDDTGVYTVFIQHSFSAWQSGGNIIVDLFANGGSLGSIAGTLAGVGSIAVNPTRATQPVAMPVGHITVWPSTQIPAALLGQYDSYGVFVDSPAVSAPWEAATDRLKRVCAEEGVPLVMPAVPADAVQRMGWQPTATFADLCGESEQVDGGVLHERGFGLGYLPRFARYNQPATLTIDLSTYATSGRDDPLAPIYDDQDLRNRWTVERTDGSFAAVDSPVSQRQGIYADSVQLNLADDSVLVDQASWRLHLDSNQDMREASFPVDLAANPTLIDRWLSCQIGSRITRTNPPAQYRPGPINRLIAGWTETIGRRSWLVQVAPMPADPWDVATADGVQRAAADGSTLAAPLTISGVSLSLASTAANGVWTTNAADFPLDIRVGGERVTLSAISGASSPQTATISARAVNGIARSWPAGTEVDVWQPAIASL